MTFYTYSQEVNNYKSTITTWYQNKPGAVSISFDDACFTQYLYAYPVLEKNNIKGTFSIVGEWVGEQVAYTAEPDHFEIQRMGWPQLLELHEHGHELAAHGYNHERYDKHLPLVELANEMEKIKTLIESRTGSGVFTLHYPYSYASGNIPEAACEAGFLFGRTGLDTINPPTPPDMLLLATHAVLNSETPDSMMLQSWMEQSKGNWLILMYHHLFPVNSKEMDLLHSHNVENTYSLPPEAFEKQVKTINSTGYWIAPIGEVGKYITERNNTTIQTVVAGKKVHIFTVTNLDKRIYNQPLTLEVNVPWKKVKVEGSLNDGIFKTVNNKLYIDVMPEVELILTKD